MRKALNMISSKKADEIVLMNIDSKLIVCAILKCIMYPIKMGKVPIKARVKPLKILLSNEIRLKIFFWGNKTLRVMIIGIKVTEYANTWARALL